MGRVARNGANKKATETRTTEARATARPEPRKPALGRRDVNRIMLVLVGGALLGAALITPWWTRGLTYDWDEQDNPRPVGGMYEGAYVQYRPFATPGSLAGFSTDGSRETATAVLGVALVICALFAWATSILRIAMRFEWVETNHDLPVRFAIIATILGIFAVVWGAFFLPLLGVNPGWLYGDEAQGGADNSQVQNGDGQTIIESTRYANVGFFLGIIGGVAYPAALWFDAARTRALNTIGTTMTMASRTPITF